MTSLMVGIYGLYLIAVGVKGNTKTLMLDLQQDAGGFVPWLLIVIVLLALYDVPGMQNFAEAFAVLAMLGLIVNSHSTIIPQFEQLYANLTGSSILAASPGNAVTSTGQPMTGSN